MTFKAKEPEPKPGRDCKDFKPMVWDRECCKLANKCANAGSFVEGGYFPTNCGGILAKLRRKIR